MSGVYVQGMKMPVSCLSCDFCNPFVDEPYCRRLMRKTPKTTRLPDCPFTAVPPHGRLIDADDLLKRIDDAWNGRTEFRAATLIEYINDAPTVLPADKEAPT